MSKQKSTPATALADLPIDIPGIDLPEVRSVVLPGGQPVAPAVAAQHDQAQIEAMRMAARQEAQRKAMRIGKLVETNESFDTDAPDYWNFCVEIWNEKFYLRDIDGDTQEYTVRWRGDTAKKLKIAVETLDDQSFLRNNLNGDQQVVLMNESREMKKRVLKACLVKTSIEGKDFTGDNVVKLPNKVQEALVIWAQEGANLSEDEAQFPESGDSQSD